MREGSGIRARRPPNKENHCSCSLSGLDFLQCHKLRKGYTAAPRIGQDWGRELCVAHLCWENRQGG